MGAVSRGGRGDRLAGAGRRELASCPRARPRVGPESRPSGDPPRGPTAVCGGLVGPRGGISIRSPGPESPGAWPPGTESPGPAVAAVTACVAFFGRFPPRRPPSAYRTAPRNPAVELTPASGTRRQTQGSATRRSTGSQPERHVPVSRVSVPAGNPEFIPPLRCGPGRAGAFRYISINAPPGVTLQSVVATDRPTTTNSKPPRPTRLNS